MASYIINGNYGNESIALLQWVIEAKLTTTCIVSVDTGWAGEGWLSRVKQGERYARQHHIQAARLQSSASFADLVRDREEFPSQKYQWCAGMLKGLALNAWLDDVDPHCEAVVLLAKRQSAARGNCDLMEFIPASDYYGGRKVWHPLHKHTTLERNQLINKAGFAILPHRSAECAPCIHATPKDLLTLASVDVEKTAILEQGMGQVMFPVALGQEGVAIKSLVRLARQQASNVSEDELFSMGCGLPWACGE